MVKVPEDYDHSSYKAKIGLKEIKWLDYDPVYLALGKTDNDRQKEYQKWIHENIPEDEWKIIGDAIQKDWAYGNDKFKEEIENALGRRFEMKKAGRKPNKM